MEQKTNGWKRIHFDVAIICAFGSADPAFEINSGKSKLQIQFVKDYKD